METRTYIMFEIRPGYQFRMFGLTKPMKFRVSNTQQKQHQRGKQSLGTSGLGLQPRQLFAFGRPQIQPPHSASSHPHGVVIRMPQFGISRQSNGWQMMVWMPAKHSGAQLSGSNMAQVTRLLCGRIAINGGSSKSWRISAGLGIHSNQGQILISGHISRMR